jgi:hypothetical protein
MLVNRFIGLRGQTCQDHYVNPILGQNVNNIIFCDTADAKIINGLVDDGGRKKF